MGGKVAFFTLGCKVNYYETEALKRTFENDNFQVVDFDRPADVYVINTCTVTHLAARKSRRMIRRARKNNPGAVVVVTGCYSQVSPEEVAGVEGVDLLTGTRGRLELPQMVKKKLFGGEVRGGVTPYGEEDVFEELPWQPEQGRTRAFLKIQDGCNQKCSYCVVPLARGPLRSLPPEVALERLRQIGREGFREAVITGIHLGLYGADLSPPVTLADLLNEAVEVEEIARIRLSSIEPADFDSSLIEAIGHERICDHLHIPLQSGDDKVLNLMRRPYDTAYFSSLLQELRSMAPGLAVSSDVMVGFPGEGEKEFQNSLEFVRQCGFSRLHVFKYSSRRGTAAFEMEPQVSPQEKEERSRQMRALGEELANSFRQQFLGEALSVLFEKEVSEEERIIQCPSTAAAEETLLEGLSSNYLRVRAVLLPRFIGSIEKVLIETSGPGFLQGRCLVE